MAAENYRVSSQHPSVMSMQSHRQSIRPQGQQGYQPELTKQRYIYTITNYKKNGEADSHIIYFAYIRQLSDYYRKRDEAKHVRGFEPFTMYDHRHVKILAQYKNQKLIKQDLMKLN